MSEARFVVGDVFERMAEIPDGSINCLITSPPFLALRSYLPADHPDKHLEIGSEATPAAFLSTLLALTREWRRLLAPHGSLCVELGDTYAGSSAECGNAGGDALYKNGRGTEGLAKANTKNGRGWPQDKSLCLLPTLYPASLAYGRNLLARPAEADGSLSPDDLLDPWRIRNLIVWHRPNPPVGALGDKVRPSTSYVTVACMSRTRWFDLDAERNVNNPERMARGELAARSPKYGNGEAGGMCESSGSGEWHPAGAPPLDCWTIPTAPYSGSHYATFPPALPRKLINLMCPRQVCTSCGEPRRRIVQADRIAEKDDRQRRVKASEHRLNAHDYPPEVGWEFNRTTLGWTDCGHNQYRRGIVLDPFAGSGTTLMAASELGRDSIGIDLDNRNLDLARQRLGMFLVEEDEVVA